VVDDGSRDATGRIAIGWSRLTITSQWVHHEVTGDMGERLISGIRAATAAVRTALRRRCQFDPADLRLLAERIGDHDVVVGAGASR